MYNDKYKDLTFTYLHFLLTLSLSLSLSLSLWLALSHTYILYTDTMYMIRGHTSSRRLLLNDKESRQGAAEEQEYGRESSLYSEGAAWISDWV